MKKEKQIISYRNVEPILEEVEGKKHIKGIIPYNSISENLGGFKEIIAPSAFNKTINDGADVKALVSHDTTRILGRVKNGTLILTQSDEGLLFDILVNEKVSYALDCYYGIERGDVKGVSFGFVSIKDEFDNENSISTLLEVKLFEISVGVVFPAYGESNSMTEKRSIDDLINEMTDEEKKELREKIDLLIPVEERAVVEEPSKITPKDYTLQLQAEIEAYFLK